MSLRVFGVGEMLWDLLPFGAQMGGAPANFTCHARALGAEAGVITRSGRDALGDDILRRFEALGLLRGMPLDVVHRLANEVARYVCGCAGATPPLPAGLRAAAA